ncbi:MAG: Sec-independent protein translocase protein TatB [Parasphingorhabdus sp.]
MFDIGFPEMAVIAMIAVIVIGPSELPRALATAGKWMGKARGVMANFRTGMDAMVREAELQEMEKKWASENERIMKEHPALPDPGEEEPKMEAKAETPGAPTDAPEPKSDDTTKS